MRRKIRDEDVALAYHLFLQGISIRDLAALYQVSRATLYWRFRKLRAQGLQPYVPHPLMSTEQLMEAASLRKQGYSLRRLAERYQVSASTLFRYQIGRAHV